MFIGNGTPGKLVKKLAALQVKARKAQEDIASQRFTGTAGAGAVTVTLDGKHNLLEVKILPDTLQEDPDLVADLVRAAFADANCKLEAYVKARTEDIYKGMPFGLSIPTS